DPALRLRPARRARRGTRTPDRDGRTEVDGAGAQLAAAHRHRPGAAHRSRTRSAGHRPARAAEPRWGCGPLRTRALVDEDDDAAGAAVLVRLAVLVAAVVAIWVMLLSAARQHRLQR